MSDVLMWLLQAVGILAIAVIAILAVALVFGLLFAIGYSIYKGWKDGDGDA